MGVPIRHIIPCTNRNDIIYRIFRNGDFSSDGMKDYHQTLSPAMDIQIPYNMERYLWVTFNGDCQYVQKVMYQFERDSRGYRFGSEERQRLGALVTWSYTVSNEMIRESTIDFVKRTHYTPCPHSACGIYGALEFMKRQRNEFDNTEVPMVAVMTAHPSKFPQIVTDIMKGQMDKKKEYIWKNTLFHHFLPKEEDKEEFIMLTHGDNWEKTWIDRIKDDIVKMNRITSKM